MDHAILEACIGNQQEANESTIGTFRSHASQTYHIVPSIGEFPAHPWWVTDGI